MHKSLLAAVAVLAIVAPAACTRPAPPTAPLQATEAVPAAAPSAAPTELPPTPTPTAILPTPTSTEPPPTPTPTEVPPTPSPTPQSLEAFESLLIEALRARDEDLLAALMGDPFAMGLWLSEGISLPATEAAERLLAEYVPLGGGLTLERPSRDSLTVMLSGTDPYTIWGPEVTIVSVLYGTGWGGGGSMRAFLAIGEGAGGYYWHGILVGKEYLFAPTGQAGGDC